MSRLKKFVTYTTVVTTIVWSVGLLAIPMTLLAASSGDLIKLQCGTGAAVNDPCKAVYYVGADSKRYVFPDEKTFKTWYSNFSGVKIVSSTEMSSYAIGGNVTYRPGVKMIKITTDPKVYAVSDNGTLHWVTTAAIAQALYGASWATMVQDVSDAFFVNYTVGSDINAAADFNPAAETADASSINDDKNLAGGGVPSGSSVAISLAADTPASGLIVGNSIHNLFTKVNITASADGAITIDQIKVKRGGTVAADGAFSGIVILDAATMQRTEDPKTLNSEHLATFNKDITIPAGTTRSFYLAGNMASSLASYAGQIPSLDLFSVVLAGGAVVQGTLPIVGNYQSLDGTISIGTLTLANGSNNPSASTQKIGVTDYIVSGVKLTANGTEDFKVSSITFDQGGTVSNTDVTNLDLLVDDAVVATVASVNSDGKVTFNFTSNPILIEKGKNKNFDLRLDIGDGSARTIRFDIEDETDIQAKGQTYGANVKLSAGTGATADGTPFWTGPLTTISEGSLRIGPATLTAANVADDSTQVTLGRFEFEAKGEPISISSLPINFTITTSSASTVGNVTHADLTNLSLYDENGVVVAGPIDPSTDYDVEGSRIIHVGATTTDSITINPGLHYYILKGDVGADFEASDTLVAHIKPSGITAKGDTTGITITPTPSTEQSSATMTVKSAALAVALSNTPVAQEVVAGTQNYTFANINLDAADSGEDVKVTSVKVAISTATGNPSQTSNWSLYDGANKLAVSNDPDSDVSTKTTASASATATFTLTTPLVISKGTAKTLTVKGNISNSATNNGTIAAGIPDSVGADHVTAKGNDSAADATLTISVSNGPTQTVKTSGQITITQDSSTPDPRLLPRNANGVTVAVLQAFSEFEDMNIEKMYVTATAINSGGWDQVETLYLYKGSELIKTVTPTSSDGTNRTVLIDISNAPLKITKDTVTQLTFKVDTPDVDYGNSNASSFQGFAIAVNAAGDTVVKGAASGTELADSAKTVSGATGNNMYLVRSTPTVTPDDQLADGVGNQTLSQGNVADVTFFKFKVSADSGGDVAIYSVSFVETKAKATSSSLTLWEGSTQVASASTTTYIAGTSGEGAAATHLHTFIFTTDGALSNLISGSTTSNLLPTNSVIPAGSSRTFTLKGSTECGALNTCSGTSGSGSIQFQLLGDGTVVGTSPVATRAFMTRMGAIGAGTSLTYEYSFLWSDFWRTSILGRSSTTATRTEQWLNGFRVKDSTGEDLPATSTATTISR